LLFSLLKKENDTFAIPIAIGSIQKRFLFTFFLDEKSNKKVKAKDQPPFAPQKPL
jgi:hypothetical protein